MLIKYKTITRSEAVGNYSRFIIMTYKQQSIIQRVRNLTKAIQEMREEGFNPSIVRDYERQLKEAKAEEQRATLIIIK